MEAKKNPQADIYQQRSRFFLIGLIISISLVITAFEWQTEKRIYTQPVDDSRIEPLPFIPLTNIQQPKIITPPVVAPKKMAAITPNPTAFTEVPDHTPTDETSKIDIETPEIGIQVLPEPESDTTAIIIFAEVQPKPVGGLENFYRTISKNIKYPTVARKIGTEGKVLVEFVVDRKGNATQIKLLKGIGSGCDEEAMRVIALPKWEPGKQRGKSVNVKMVMPVNFRLSGI